MGTQSASTESHFRLLILSDGSVRTIPLTGNRWTIGRSLDCAITLRDPTVSRRHLQLERADGIFRFQDLGGANPALLDGKPARSGTIAEGQQLTIGLTRLVLEARRQPSPVATSQVGTVVLSREVVDEELPPSPDPSSYPATAAKVLERIEWTFADLGDLTHAAEPLLELALNLTNHQTGWLARFPRHGQMETLATTAQDGAFSPSLEQSVIDDARRIGQPHILRSEENGQQLERLIVPLGPDGDGMMVLEAPAQDAPGGQDLLILSQSLGKVIWHRLQETLERTRLRDELERLRFHGTTAHNALLRSSRLQSAREQVRAAANDTSDVLLIGEPGTEREDLARYLHAESAQRAAPFVSWNAGKTPADSQPLEVFGNGENGGLLQRAAGGTLFIDSPNAMPLELQQEVVAALESLEKGITTRLIVAADKSPTDDPTWAIELQQRLNRLPIQIPPLREDSRDVLALAEMFLSELGTCPDGSPRLMTERCKRFLTAHTWPGNVRELRLTLEAAAAKARNRAITPRHLPPQITSTAANNVPILPTLSDVERAHIQEVMVRTGGVRARAAQVLGIASSTLYEKLKKYEIE